MGTAIRAVAFEFPELHIEHVFVKADQKIQFEKVSATPGTLENIDVIVDFSAPSSCLNYATAAAQQGIPFVTGTTGLSTDQQTALHDLAAKTALLAAANFSVGINIVEHLVELAARASAGYDIEVFEAHHRRKVDAPSGTALFLGEAAARGRNMNLAEVAKYDRRGLRTDDEIGFQVLRGGGIVGEHTVFFVAEGERIELTHRAHDRAIFARGALRAATWIAGKPNGDYTMRDVLFS